MHSLAIRMLPFVLFLFFYQTKAQQTDRKLEAATVSLIKNFRGDIGVYVKNLRTGKTVAIQADTIFPTASMIKIPILVGVMQKIEEKELSYHQKLVYKDSLFYAGEDVLAAFKHNEAIELSKVMMLMLTLSDNTASLWLQGLSGGGNAINTLMEKLGLPHTRVNSRTPGRESNRSQYGWGQTTPREMATLMEKIYRKEVLSTTASLQMMRMLG
ncbi:MAG: serine hydrolase, partial [Chitinophagaceae bacterium]